MKCFYVLIDNTKYLFVWREEMNLISCAGLDVSEIIDVPYKEFIEDHAIGEVTFLEDKVSRRARGKENRRTLALILNHLRWRYPTCTQ